MNLLKKTYRKKWFLGEILDMLGKPHYHYSSYHPGTEKHPAYLNWDSPVIKNVLLAGQLPPQQKLSIFDEIHKYKN